MDWVKAIIIMIFHLGILSEALGQSAYSEETGTLESIYESRARAVLNTLLRPQEYTLIISADLEKDEAKMKAYREKLELEYLPGLPMPGDPTLKPATNSLHEMKSKVTVHLVLSPEVTADKETILKTILANKLHLDEGNGDSIHISRAPFPADPKAESPPPSIFPEFTWKTWSLILLLALLLLAGIVYYASKRSQNKDREQNRNPLPEPAVFTPSTQAPSPLAFQGDSSVEELPGQGIATEDLEREKDCILNLATQYPQICSNIAVALIEKAQEKDLLIVFNHLGWDLAKKLMSEIPPRAWARLGQKLRLKTARPTIEELFKSLSEIHKELLAGVLESGALSDEKNPFAFLTKATPAERLQILKDESATNLAVISFFMNPQELNETLQVLPSDLQIQVTTAMSRLQTLPDAVIKSLSQQIFSKLIHFRKEPTTSIDGAAIAGRTLRAMSPEREFEVYSHMQDSNPDEAEKIRRLYLQFSDLPLFPKDAVALALGESEIEVLVKAFKNQKEDFLAALLSLLPPKRANMVRRDLESPAIQSTTTEQWTARRFLVLKIEEYFNKQGFSIKSIWEQIESEKLGAGLERKAS